MNKISIKMNMKKVKKILLGILIVFFMIVATLGGWILYNMGVAGVGPLKFIGLNRDPVQLTDTVHEYKGSTFITKVSGQKVVGTLYTPNETNSYSDVVVLSHGFGSSAAILAAKAESLAEAGVPALVYDFRGGSTSSKSDGKTIDMSISTEKADLHTMINQIKQTNGFNNAKIYLYGESMGGLVTALVASERKDIAGLTLCFPAFPSPEFTRSTYASVDAIPDTYDVLGMNTGKGFWSDLWKLDIYKEMEKYTGNVIILYGSEDKQVSREYMEKANRIYKNSELMIIEGAGHGFSGKNEKSSLKTIYEFVIKNR